ncbi:hypothetical protein ES703_43067 [subsurface metagenome]
MEKEIKEIKGLPVMKKKEVEKAKEIIVIDIKMKFWSMVWFMVQWAIASIPAFFILVIMIMLFTAMLTAITQGF